MRIKISALLLWILSIGSAFLALKANTEPVPLIFKNKWFGYLFEPFSTGNSIIFNLSVGFLVSIVFYLLVVWYPERRKKSTIKHNLAETYRFF